MAKIIDIGSKRQDEGANLNAFLRQARVFAERIKEDSTEWLRVLDPKEFEERLKRQLFAEAVRGKLIGSDVFLCALYVSKMLAETAKKPSLCLVAVDYLLEHSKTGNAFVLRQGGDVCFLVCAVFLGRAKWRLMDENYYRKMGAGFYYQFYAITGREIGYHMSRLFEPMTKVTQKCLKNL